MIVASIAATRMHGYTEAGQDRLRRQGETDADGEVRVLPMVLYSGDRPWNGWGGVAEVGVTSGGEAWLPVRGTYLLLGANRRAREDLPRDNLVAAVFELNASETPGATADRMSAMPGSLDGDPLRAIIDWIRAVFPKKFPQADAAGGDRVAGAGVSGNRERGRDHDGVGEASPRVGGRIRPARV